MSSPFYWAVHCIKPVECSAAAKVKLVIRFFINNKYTEWYLSLNLRSLWWTYDNVKEWLGYRSGYLMNQERVNVHKGAGWWITIKGIGMFENPKAIPEFGTLSMTDYFGIPNIIQFPIPPWDPLITDRQEHSWQSNERQNYYLVFCTSIPKAAVWSLISKFRSGKNWHSDSGI